MLKSVVRPRFILAILLILVSSISIYYRIRYYISSEHVNLILDRRDSQWIQYPHTYNLHAIEPCIAQTLFRTQFTVPADVRDADLHIRALSNCAVWLDGTLIHQDNTQPRPWKSPVAMHLMPLRRGQHELTVICSSVNTVPAIQVQSSALPVSTPRGWLAAVDGQNWKQAIPVKEFKTAGLSLAFPTVAAAFLDHLAFWMALPLIIFSFLFLYRSDKIPIKRLLSALFRPHVLRWAVLLIWMAISINDAIKLKLNIGFDIEPHIRYVIFILDNKMLPLASDGWQMFQTPLNYILSAPVFWTLRKLFNEQIAIQWLRIIPIACGMLQIEIVYRLARRVFPDKESLQNLAVLFAAFLPMHTYMCQSFGNEPLAGMFISLTLYYCFDLFHTNAQILDRKSYLKIGLVLGLAVLSKVTAILLIPVIVIAIVIKSRDSSSWIRPSLSGCLWTFGSAFCICSCYFIRNYLALGQIIITHSNNFQWWQFPSIRTLSQFTSFGASLVSPIYAGTHGFWDSLYSSFWLDGYLSGIASYGSQPTWNYAILIPGAWLAMIPMVLLFCGGLRAFALSTCHGLSRDLQFSLIGILVFLAAMMDLYITLPIYSVGKASYLLGLIPLFSILIAAGAEPLMKRRLTRDLTIGLFACWIIASGLAYIA